MPISKNLITIQILNFYADKAVESIKVEVWKKGVAFDELLLEGVTKKDGYFYSIYTNESYVESEEVNIYFRLYNNGVPLLYSLAINDLGQDRVTDAVLEAGENQFTLYVDSAESEEKIQEPQKVFFQLLDSDENIRPFTIVGIQIKKDDLVIVDLGTEQTNAQAYFGTTLNITNRLNYYAETFPEDLKFRFYVLNSLGNVAGSAEIDYANILDANLLQAYQVTVTITPLNASLSKSIEDLSTELSISISSTLGDYLAEENIETLRDIRKKGGLKNIEALAGVTYEDDQETILKLDGHARLEMLSVNYAYNNFLINSSIDSFPKILEKNYYDFVEFSLDGVEEPVKLTT